MSATLTVPDHFPIQFGENWSQLATQKKAKLMDFCMVKDGCTGKAETHNQYGDVEDEETTGTRYAKTTLEDLPTDMRWIRPRQFKINTGEDTWDDVSLGQVITPRGEQTVAHYTRFAKRCDDILISALRGTAYSGADGTTANALPSGQKVAKDFVYDGSTTDSSFEPAKVIRALKILTDNDVIDDDDMGSDYDLCGVMTPTCEEYLRLVVNGDISTGRNLFSRDYAPPVLDEKGRIRRWLGINWKVSTRGGLVDTSDASLHYAAIWVKSGMQFDFWKNFTNSIHVMPGNNEALLFLTKYSMNAARLEEEKVVEIAADTDA